MAAGANSINTNPGALIALQNLNSINNRLDVTQNRVATGFKVGGAVDDASSFSIAQGLRGELKAYEAVSQGIANATGVLNVAEAGATALSNLAGDIKKKVTELANGALTSAQRTILSDDFTQLLVQARDFLNQATFQGNNLLASDAADTEVISDIDGSTITIRANNLIDDLDTFSAAADVTSAANSVTTLSDLATFETAINTALGNIGADTRRLKFQDEFIGKIADAVEVGLGSIVDADLAKESAKLQALQIQQQLSSQTLSIANQRPSVLLSLFR
ncbi:MAG: flagellin [Alphaproteobacteria bacterium]|nr:flagellin [Alphaproteobacteria bacterium]MBU0797005.1 flagellin [Alphaproteobacteria bacterium]MBU0886588.1 flagellin [Alphaproteobacteria bacterium]MBU1814177.1 flagellin [Alphaproteobacteria bacterium]MBU2092097.1 flagellin [Alphaproteobacteria bacterium]